MRTPIFIGLMVMAFAPAVAQTSDQSTTAPTSGTSAAQTAPGQSMPGPNQNQPATGAMGGAMTDSPAGTTAMADVKSQLTSGTKVYDTKGGEVGTIEEVKGDRIVVSTGAERATLAPSDFAAGSTGPVIAMTRTELESAVRKAKGNAPTGG